MMFTSRTLATVAVAALTLGTSVVQAAPETEEDKTIYALGMLVSRNLATFNLTEDEIKMLNAGIRDSLLGADTHGVDPQAYQAGIQQLAQQRALAASALEKTASEAFLAKQADMDGAMTTESGLIYTTLVEGDGAMPTAQDKVTVHYHGTLRDGTVFDSSVDRGTPATFSLSGVIPCWTEGVQKMKVGGKARLVCPSSIAYGERGAGGAIGPGAALMFEVELISIGE
ncbi:MAG: peptidyl-prolyl cis-trans isomerase [Lysobacteraceae bacterium]|nr:MAG: peptidyl-prolyl cis-trans isomerase [Xanthomonadaceae bacterium]